MLRDLVTCRKLLYGSLVLGVSGGLLDTLSLETGQVIPTPFLRKNELLGCVSKMLLIFGSPF